MAVPVFQEQRLGRYPVLIVGLPLREVIGRGDRRWCQRETASILEKRGDLPTAGRPGEHFVTHPLLRFINQGSVEEERLVRRLQGFYRTVGVKYVLPGKYQSLRPGKRTAGLQAARKALRRLHLQRVVPRFAGRRSGYCERSATCSRCTELRIGTDSVEQRTGVARVRQWSMSVLGDY